MDRNVESPHMPDTTPGSHTDSLRQFLLNHMLYRPCDPHFWMRKVQSGKIKRSAQVTQLISQRAKIWTLSPHMRCSLMAPQQQKYQCQLRSQLSMNLNRPMGHVPDDVIPACFQIDPNLMVLLPFYMELPGSKVYLVISLWRIGWK